MTDEQLVLGPLSAVMDSFPDVAPDRLVAETMAVVRDTPQRRAGWRQRFRSADGRAPLATRLVAFSAMAAALLVLVAGFTFLLGRMAESQGPAATVPTGTAAAVIATAPSSPQGTFELPAGWKYGTVDGFEVPFEYSAPSTVVVGVSDVRSFTLLSPPSEPGAIPLPTPGLPLVQTPYNGIVVASVTNASIDTCPRRGAGGWVAVKRPTDLETILRVDGGMDVESAPARIDGRPASLVQIDPGERCLDHLHVDAGDSYGLYEKTINLSVVTADAGRLRTARTYFVEVADTTVVIQIWGASRGEFDRWLPTAEQIVESIHFHDEERL